MTITTAATATPFRRHLLALVDVIEDHCKDLDVVHADAAVNDVHVALGTREHAVTLASRLAATQQPGAAGRVWVGTVTRGVHVVRVQISDWSSR